MPRVCRRTAVAATLIAIVASSGLEAVACRPGARTRRDETRPAAGGARGQLVGSGSCRGCHAAFHEKWATSFHGLAMRPMTPAFAREQLLPQRDSLLVAGRRYRVVLEPGAAAVEESGPQGARRWPILHLLGGKNVCYFLTERERGFLQVLPLAWDVRRREWFPTAASAVRHAQGLSDEALPWTDRAYTFNTSCFGCHVSRFSSNYDPATDSYRSTWAEPGISCESCHGPAGEHVALFEDLARKGASRTAEARAAAGATPVDPRIVSVKAMTTAQRNDLCAACHAKASPLGTAGGPGDPFFDHFDLVTLESPDYHPDGRDLGENYTLTSWLASPCVKAGGLDCLHCHTSSGRYRFQERPDGACLPCHEARVRDGAAHSHHAPGRPGGRCTDCHMPQTEFARMRRSDHSMRPPLPGASLAFGSPNACTECHRDRDDRWAARVVRRWRAAAPPRDRAGGGWEARTLREGRLVAAARRGDWTRLDAILEYIAEPDGGEVVKASLARLLIACPDEAKRPALRKAARDSSPLVRAAAVAALADDPASLDILAAASRDERRLVRVRAAEALAGRERELSEGARADLARALGELEAALAARPDQAGSHFALGNLDLDRARPAEAAAHFRRAVELRPDDVASLVNLSLAEARQGRLADAEPPLRAAIRAEPQSVPARLNLALLLGETGRGTEAESELERVLELEPGHAQALHNLATLVAERDLARGIALARRAASAAPGEPRYAWTAAWLAARAGDPQLARRLSEELVRRHPGHADGWRLLGSLLERQGRRAEAREVYRRAARVPALGEGERRAFEAQVLRVE